VETDFNIQDRFSVFIHCEILQDVACVIICILYLCVLFQTCVALLFCVYRGVGCIFYEMGSGHALFPGSSVDEQLQLIFKMLGTPSEATWPGITQIEEFRAYGFARYRPEPLLKHVPRYAQFVMNKIFSLF